MNTLFYVLKYVCSKVGGSVATRGCFTCSSLLYVNVSVCSNRGLISPGGGGVAGSGGDRGDWAGGFLCSSGAGLLRGFFLRRLSSCEGPRTVLIRRGDHDIRAMRGRPPFTVVEDKWHRPRETFNSTCFLILNLSYRRVRRGVPTLFASPTYNRILQTGNFIRSRGN